MQFHFNRRTTRLPRRFPVGATYVVEGFGGEAGKLRVVSRYVVLPGGKHINVPAALGQPPSSRVPGGRGNRRLPKAANRPKGRPLHRQKFFLARSGTARQRGR